MRLRWRFLFVWVATSGCASSSSDISRSEAPLINGAEDDRAMSIVGLARFGTIYCSGTLIGPARVLTAAHCVDRRTPDAVLVTTRFIGVRSVRMHPSFDRLSLAHDLALVELVEAAPVLPASLASEVPYAVGDSVTVLGYGAEAFGHTPSKRRRRGTMTVDAIAADSLMVTGSPSQPCSGDSGGALLSDDGSELVGVISGGDPLCEKSARIVRIDAERQWLDERARDGCAFSGRSRYSDVANAWTLVLAAALARRSREPNWRVCATYLPAALYRRLRHWRFSR